MSRMTHVQGTLASLDAKTMSVGTYDGNVIVPRPSNLRVDAGLGDVVTLRCAMNQSGTCVLAVVTGHRLKVEIDAEAAARAAADAEFHRPKDVEATISWHRCFGEGCYENSDRFKWYGQNLERFWVQPCDDRPFWLERGAERLLLDVRSVLAEGEEMKVVVTFASGKFVSGSMRRL